MGPGIFTETSFVLAAGVYTDCGIFEVSQLGLPTSEPRSITINTFGAINLFDKHVSCYDNVGVEQLTEYDW